MNTRALISISLLLWFFTGCGTAMIADMEPDWTSDERVQNLGSAYVMNDGRQIFVGNDRKSYLIDGNSGQTVASMGDTFWESVAGNMNVESVNPILSFSGNTREMVADAYTLIPLEKSGVMLVMDYRFATESIVALDSQSGEEIWKRTDLSYSLGNYNTAIERFASSAGRKLADMLGGESEEEDPEDRRERLINFTKHVVYPVEGKDLFFLKTHGGLSLIDSKTGEIKFNSNEFNGAGIADVKELPNGDYLVLSGGQSLANLEISKNYHLARFSPDGEQVWMSDHLGRDTDRLWIEGDIALIDGVPTEAYSLDDGSKLWENEVSSGHPYHHVILDGEYLYFASDVQERTGRLEESKVWKQHISSGTVVWESRREKGVFRGLMLDPESGTLLAYGENEFFKGGNGGVVAFNSQSGEELWITPEFNSAGMQLSGIFGSPATRPIVLDGIAYTAGPEYLYALNMQTGEPIYTVSHSEQGTGVVLGTELFQDKIVVIGRDAVAAYNHQGDLQYSTKIDRADRYEKSNGDTVVLKRSGEMAHMVNLEDGNRSPVMRHNADIRVFGNLDNTVYIAPDLSYSLSIDSDGRLLRHSF